MSTLIEKNSHISTAEIEHDIAETEVEIVTMRREIEGFRLLGDRWSHMRADARITRISEREEFIAKLRQILQERRTP